MTVCYEEYLHKLDLVDELMLERQQLSKTTITHSQRLKVIEENIRALNTQLLKLEKQFILQHYEH